MRPRHDPDLIRQHLSERESEGLTFAQLTERSGIPLHVYRHRITQDKRNTIPASTTETEDSAFVEVLAPAIDATSESSGIEIHFANDFQILLSKDFDADTLKRLLLIVRC